MEDPEANIQLRPSGWGKRPFLTPGLTQATASGSRMPDDMTVTAYVVCRPSTWGHSKSERLPRGCILPTQKQYNCLTAVLQLGEVRVAL